MSSIYDTLKPQDFEAIGAELDAIREDVLADLGNRDAEYIRGLIKRQRQLEIGGRALMMLPPT